MRKVRRKTEKGFIFVICGPSGSGKTTIAKRLLKQPRLKGRLIKPVSFTTRPRRQGEKEGQDYHFVCAREFHNLLKAEKILEHTRYLGYDYGTPRDYVEGAIRKGLHIILCLDIKGVEFIKRSYPDRAITIFVKPPSLGIAKKRILTRSNKTTPQEVNKRVKLASKELNYISRCDYCLINDSLARAVKDTEIVIQEVLKFHTNQKQ